eukprot:TRINITY_DN4808_c0_g1_i1.p1 TRINITY_DN4808_c0_g1~~TRINITY_DN4808_c0_g1_i1.p1  ORF type:complete len:816 (+),score=134.84 TRINITY_DN4808_c0_g1_i1:57-2504(+)
MDFLKQIPLNEAIDQFCNPLRESSSHVEALNSIILSVHRNEVDLEGIVRSLGEYLTSVDDRVRARGTLCLSELLTRLPKLSLNQKSITTLFTFYTDRMRDLPCVAEVMTGLYAISSHHMLTEGQEMLFFESLIKEEVVVQAFSVTTRNRVFQVIQTLIQKYLHLLRHEINKVARAAVRAFDGEKDPRNLMIIFPLSSIFFEEDIDEENTEELFDVISCYFPILFKPGPNDPYGITREQLVSSLRDAMTKDAKVAKHAIPFLLKKLSSALVETKVEALQTIVRFFQQVPMESLSSFWGDVWVAIRTETMDYQTSQASSSANSSVFETTLETFHKIIKFVPKFHDDIFQTKETLFPADYLLADCLDCVKGTNTYPFLYYAPLVDGALSAGGADMVSHFYSKIFEPMLSNLELLVTQSKHMKESHFLSMIPFLKNAKDESIHPFNVIPVVHRALDLCFQIIGDVSTPPSVSKAAIDVIYTFLSQLSHPAVRKEQCQRFLVYCVQEATNPLSKHPREVYAKVLSELSTSYPDLFLSVAIDKVMIKLQQLLQGPPDAELESLTDFVQSLSVNTLDIFAPTIERLSTILTGLITQDSTEVSRLHVARIISLLSSMIEKGSSLVSTETREIPATFCMSPLVAAMESPPLSRDVNIISLLVEFALLSCRILSLSQQQELVRWASTSIVDHMQEDSGDGTSTRLLIFSAILSNARPEALPMAMEQVIDHYQGHIDKCCSLDTIRLAVQTIAAILNKAPSEVSDVQILESARSWLNLSKQEAIGSDYRQTLVASIGWVGFFLIASDTHFCFSFLELDPPPGCVPE